MMLLALALALVAQQPTDFNAAWTQVTEEIRENYFGRVIRQQEMEERLARYAPIAQAAQTRDEFSATVNRMIGEFGDSHFYFFTKDDELFYAGEGARRAGWDGVPQDGLRYPGVGCWFWPTDKGYQVWSLEHSGRAFRQGVRRLDIFETCEGEPFHPIRSLRGKVGQTLTFGIQRDGQRIELKLPVHAMYFWRDLEQARTALNITYENKKFLYLWFSSMYGKTGQFDFYAKSTGDVDGLILDLRDGLGGFFEPHVLPFFLPEATVRWHVPGTEIAGGWSVGLIKPMVVLTNRKTLSAREFAAYYLRKHAGATIVGEPTAGAVLGGYITPTYGWWNMMIPSQEYSIDGIVFERNPLQPDVLVEDRVSVDGYDTILERGIEVLHEKLTESAMR